jgi:2',3'-cyclic-nucleotide 2'-phosphodiesterase (5'-nucleotidase family)
MVLKEMRKNGDDPLVVDAGDMFFSKTNINTANIESEKHRCETMLKGYEKIGNDAQNIGKYELLAGLSFIKKMESRFSSIPFISANLRDSRTGKLLFSPYRIVNKDGLDIGIIGLTNMVPDTMRSIIADDYITTGNKYINELKGQVDLTIVMVNTDRSSQASLSKYFADADFIFTSGSTHRTSASMTQKKNGPFLYSNGKQGKYLSIIDLDITNINDPIFDLSAQDQKVKQLKNRLKRLQKKNPNSTLEKIYADKDNILNLIKRYRDDLKIAESSIENATNKMKYISFALNKKIKDDLEMQTMVNLALEKCSSLELNKNNAIKFNDHGQNHSH